MDNNPPFPQGYTLRDWYADNAPFPIPDWFIRMMKAYSKMNGSENDVTSVQWRWHYADMMMVERMKSTILDDLKTTTHA